MCQALEEMRTPVAEEARAEGRAENKMETAAILLKKGFDHKTVAECSVLSIEKVEELARSLS